MAKALQPCRGHSPICACVQPTKFFLIGLVDLGPNREILEDSAAWKHAVLGAALKAKISLNLATALQYAAHVFFTLQVSNTLTLSDESIRRVVLTSIGDTCFHGGLQAIWEDVGGS